MARQSGISMPSGQGGLIGGDVSSYKSNFEFSPRLVIFAAFLTVAFILVLFLTN